VVDHRWREPDFEGYRSRARKGGTFDFWERGCPWVEFTFAWHGAWGLLRETGEMMTMGLTKGSAHRGRLTLGDDCRMAVELRT